VLRPVTPRRPPPNGADEDDSWLEFDPDLPAVDDAIFDALELDGHESEPEPGDFREELGARD